MPFKDIFIYDAVPIKVNTTRHSHRKYSRRALYPKLIYKHPRTVVEIRVDCHRTTDTCSIRPTKNDQLENMLTELIEITENAHSNSISKEDYRNSIIPIINDFKDGQHDFLKSDVF